MRIAIIGAGIAGVTLGRALHSHADVAIYEKSRGVGGRMATRRADGFTYDHGAQYFTVRDERFAGVVEEARSAGSVANWPHSADDEAADMEKQRFVGAPAMNSFPKFLAEGLSVVTEAHATELQRAGESWRVNFQNGESIEADFVVSTAPAPQTGALFPYSFAGARVLDRTIMKGCFTLMLGGEGLVTPDGATSMRPKRGPVGWIALNHGKPRRSRPSALVIQSTNDWAEDNLERPQDEVTTDLVKEASALLGVDLRQAHFTSLHRWRYAAATTPAAMDYLIDEGQRLAACGDWCLGARVECAFESADRLAARLIQIIQS